MQYLKSILSIAGGTSALTDEYGKKVTLPQIKVGIDYTIELDLRTNTYDEESGTLQHYPFSELSEATAFYLCMDSDYDQDTIPPMLSFSGITLSQTEDGRTLLRAVLPKTAREGLLSVLKTSESVTLGVEIAGYTSGGSVADAIFSLDFSLQIRNRRYLGDVIPESVISDPEYLNAAQVRAIIDEYLRPEANSLSIGTVTSGETASAQINGTAPDQTLDLVLPKGDPGKDGEDGEDGEDGKTPYLDPDTKNWMINGIDSGVCAEGQKGLQGEGMAFDRSGDVTEKSLYDDEQTGFRFAATVINAEKKLTTLYIWTKLSDATADWSDPLTFVFYSAGSEAAVIQPITFDPPGEDVIAEYYHFSVADHPYATVSQVTLETADGELVLPYYSDLGIKKILKVGNEMYIYFGKNIPTYTKGRIYLSQFVTAEATQAPDLDPIPEDTSKETIYYGYIPQEQATTLNSVADITLDMITSAQSAGTVWMVEDSSLAQSLTIPRYSWMFIALEADSTLTAAKDDGFGSQTAFEGVNGVTGTTASTLKFYGEFTLISAEQKLYVTEGE